MLGKYYFDVSTTVIKTVSFKVMKETETNGLAIGVGLLHSQYYIPL